MAHRQQTCNYSQTLLTHHGDILQSQNPSEHSCKGRHCSMIKPAIRDEFTCHLYQLSTASLTNHCKLSSLKQHSLSHSSVGQTCRRLCWVLCLGCYKSEIRCWWTGPLIRGSGEESIASLFRLLAEFLVIVDPNSLLPYSNITIRITSRDKGYGSPLTIFTYHIILSLGLLYTYNFKQSGQSQSHWQGHAQTHYMDVKGTSTVRVINAEGRHQSLSHTTILVKGLNKGVRSPKKLPNRRNI